MFTYLTTFNSDNERCMGSWWMFIHICCPSKVQCTITSNKNKLGLHQAKQKNKAIKCAALLEWLHFQEENYQSWKDIFKPKLLKCTETSYFWHSKELYQKKKKHNCNDPVALILSYIWWNKRIKIHKSTYPTALFWFPTFITCSISFTLLQTNDCKSYEEKFKVETRCFMYFRTIK